MFTRMGFLIVIAVAVVLIMKFVVNPAKTTIAAIAKGAGEEVPRMRLLLPLYIYPSPGKTDYILAGQAMKTLSGRMDIIVNPANGTEATSPPNRDWVAGLDQIKTNAGTSWHSLHGYISTKYGNRSKETAKAQMTGYVTLWSKWVGNFFFDEVSLSETKFAYYAELAAHAQKILPGSKVILNPGVVGAILPPQLSTITGVASAVIFETGRDAWYKMEPQPEPQSMNSVIIALSPTFDPVNNSADASLLVDIKAKNIGSLFVNHLDCNYDSLPPYWDSLVEAVRKN